MTEQKSGKTHERRSIEFWMVLVGTIAGVVAAGAALAVFVFPTADGHSSDVSTPAASSPGSGQISPPTTSFGSSNATAADASGGNTAPPAGARPLTSMTPSAGSGFIQVKGQDLRFPCPTNESDDNFREVTYALPATYAQLTTRMTVAGHADPEATAGLQVFIQHRLDRSDRNVQVGDAVVLRQNTSASFARDLGDAVDVTLRITCQTRDQVVVLSSPRLVH